ECNVCEMYRSACNSIDEQGFRSTSKTPGAPFAIVTSLADLAWTHRDSPRTSCCLRDLRYKSHTSAHSWSSSETPMLQHTYSEVDGQPGHNCAS
ncbi:hypothetical protein EK904_005169, partial [Melospiza melodia maxima]